LFYAQFEELESFTKFGTQLDADTQKRIGRGQAIRLVLEQRQFQTLSAPEQIAVFVAANNGLFDGMAAPENKKSQEIVLETFRLRFHKSADKILQRQKLTPKDIETMVETFKKALQ
jgi:F-type H+-transporting ATPase subunit alpha